MVWSGSLKLVLRFNWPWGCVNTESNFDWPPPVEVLAFRQQVTAKQTDQHSRIITRSTLSSMDYSPSLPCPNSLIPSTFQCLGTRLYLCCVLSLRHNKSPHRNTSMLKNLTSQSADVQHFLAGGALWKKLNKPGVLEESAPLVCKWPLITQYITSQYLKVWNKPTLHSPHSWAEQGSIWSVWTGYLIGSIKWPVNSGGEGEQLYTYPKHNQHLNQRPNNKPLSSGLSRAHHRTLPRSGLNIAFYGNQAHCLTSHRETSHNIARVSKGTIYVLIETRNAKLLWEKPVRM